MTDLPVQTFLTDCKEDSLASHRHTNVYIRYDNLKKKRKKKKVQTPLIKLC